MFDRTGNRVGGSGEYVIVVRPTVRYGSDPTVRRPDAVIEVQRRIRDNWEWVTSVEVILDRSTDGEPTP